MPSDACLQLLCKNSPLPRFALICGSLALLLFFPGAFKLRGQLLYGTLAGNVSDTSGEFVAGARIVVTNTATNQSREGLSNASGGYTFPNTEAGEYTATVSMEGFQTARVTGLQVAINTVVRADITLNIGAVNESVTVTSAAATLQADRSDIRFEVDKKQLQDLSMPIGRNYQAALRLLPGFNVSGGGAIRASNPAASFTMNVNGAAAEVNNTRVDGATAANNFIQGNIAYVPALESIQTVDAVTNSFSAEIGLAGGAAINVQVKSGTNQLHGSVFEYHTDNNTKARPALLPSTQTKPKFIYNQFGGTIGGAIKKDKLFYFLSYEGTTDHRTYTTFTTVPTAAAKAGNLSESTTPIYDPATGDAAGRSREPFPGNVIPAARQSAITAKILPLWPQQNLPGLANNYFAAAPSPYDRHVADTKINWNASNKFTMFGRLGLLRWSEDYPTVFGDKLGGRTVSGQQSGNADGGTVNLTSAATYIFSPTFLIDGYFGFNRSTQNAVPRRLDEKVGLDFLGIPGTNGTRRFEGGWPRILLDGYEGVGVDEPYMPWIRHDPGYSFVSNANWTKGKHNIRFGAEVAKRDLNHAQPEIEGQIGGASGGFRFTNGVTQLNGGAAGNRDNTFAGFLLGLPQQMGRTLQVPDEIRLRSWFYSSYVQDRWDITKSLTLTYGLRWEYLPLPQRDDRGIEFYDSANNKMLICGQGSVPSACGVTMSKANFAPRAGVVYRASSTLVLRVGFGITRDPYDIGPRGVRTNYPLMISTNLQGANTYTPIGNWAAGLPAIQVPSLGNGIIPVPGTAVVHSIPKDIRRGYIASRNVSLQKELPSGFVAQASYVGTLVIRQFGNIDMNAGQVIGAGLAGEPLNAQFGRTATTPQYRPLGTTNYNSLQVTLQRRFSKGLQLGAAYTWSKAIGVASAVEGAPAVQAISYFNLNHAVLNYDRTQVFNLSSVWELPFGKGKRWLSGSRLGSAVAGGWQLNGVLTLMTGLPFTVTASGTSLNLPGSTQTADQVLGSVAQLGQTGPGTSFFDSLAFVPVTAARFGTAGFNSLRGPGLANLDLGLFRSFSITERLQMQFRAEAFNFTNTPHWANPAANISSVSYNANGSIRDLGGFGAITATNAGNLGRAGTDERTFRFGLRLSF